MKTKRLGLTDLEITRIGFGAWAIGGDWKFGWGAQDDTDSVAAILAGLEHGMNWIDTAAVYGLGHSEEVVAKALGEWKGAKPYVFTKCGMIWNDAGEIDYSGRAASIRQECENSLRRLHLDVIDLYQMHWPMDALEETLEGWATMAKLQEEGKVRWIGVSNYSVDELEAAQKVAPIASLQPPYSLVKRESGNDVLPWCLENGVGSIVYSPMGSGLLTGKMTRDRIAALPETDWRKKNPEFSEPKLTENLALVDRLKTVAAKYDSSAADVAIAWTLKNPAVTGAIVGVRNASQIAGIIGGATLELSDADIALIEGKTQ